MIRAPGVHHDEAITWVNRLLVQLSACVYVPSCMSLSVLGVTQMKLGSVPAERSVASCGYGTTRLHCAELFRTVLKYMKGLWLTS